MRLKVWLALGTIYVVWGSTFLAIAVVVRDLPPFLAMSLRHLVAGSLLFGWVMTSRRDREPLGWRQWGAAFIFGGALFLVGHGGLAWAQQNDPSGEEGAEPLGALVIVLGALGWVAGSLYSQRSPLPKDTLLGASMGMLAGGALLGVVGVGSGELNDASLTGDAVVATAYMVAVGSLIGFSAYVWLLKTVPASTVSTYAYVNPVIAVFLGWLFNDEVITTRTLLAGAAIVVGVALMVSRSEEKEPEPVLRADSEMGAEPQGRAGRRD